MKWQRSVRSILTDLALAALVILLWLVVGWVILALGSAPSP